MTLLSTKNDMPHTTREKVVEILNERLADAVDFYLQVKNAHWNVKGPQFIALHELFDEVAGHFVEHIDLIAERVVQLGGLAEGTLPAISKRTSLPTYRAELTDGPDHLAALVGSLGSFAKSIRYDINRTNELGDAGTGDLCTEVSRSVDKDLWFLESHLHKK